MIRSRETNADAEKRQPTRGKADKKVEELATRRSRRRLRHSEHAFQPRVLEHLPGARSRTTTVTITPWITSRTPSPNPDASPDIRPTSCSAQTWGRRPTSTVAPRRAWGRTRTPALVVWPGYDFHWYRLHTNGFWGHKPGHTAARNTDNQGRVIGGALNPQNCNRGPYTAFCGYRFSPVGMRVQ